MNAYAPQHSRIFKEMIIVSIPSKPFTYTAKNTARRQAIIDSYSDEIEKAYADAQESAQSNIASPSVWDDTQTLTFVRQTVSSVLGREVSDDADIFQLGCDSLQATWIRNTLLRALRDSSAVDTRRVKENIVYTNTSISTLVSSIAKLIRVDGVEDNLDLSQRVALMQSFVDKYLFKKLPQHQPLPTSQDGDVVVLVTGTTGTFGSHLLASMLEDPAVTRIYALNRRSSVGNVISARQTRSFDEWELDTEPLKATKLKLLEGDILGENFGVGEDTYTEMLNTVTHVVHNAWAVNFNLRLEAFDDNIHSVRRLIDFSLSSRLPVPMKFVFTSSVGVLQNAQGRTALPEAPVNAEIAAGVGYAESKWVAEQLVQRARAQVPSFNALIVRVGQLCGGASAGSWNTKEWFPALVQSTDALRCFPSEDKPVFWIPASTAAALLVKLATSSYRPKSDIIHLVHPRPTSFADLAAVFATALDVPRVPYKQWLMKLEDLHEKQVSGDGSDSELRALRLITFFQALASDRVSGDLTGSAKLDCTQLKASSVLSSVECKALGADNVQKWIGYWRRAGFM